MHKVGKSLYRIWLAANFTDADFEELRGWDHAYDSGVENGPEFVSKEVDLWAYANGVTLDFSRPGKPTDNAFIEVFNARLRQECLNQHWFLSLAEACTKIEQWREMDNHERPHSRLGYRTPEEFAETQQNGEKCRGNSVRISQNPWPSFWGRAIAVENSPSKWTVLWGEGQ